MDGAPPPVIRADEEDSASTALSFHKLVAQTSSLVQACKRRRTRSPAPPLSSVSQCIRRATAEAGISLPHGSYGPIEAGAGAVGPEDAERQLMPPPPPRGVARTRKPKGPPRPRSRVSAWGTSTSASSEDAAAGRENETPRPAPSRLALLTLSRASTHAPVHPPAPAPAPARAVGADDESTSGGGVDLGLNVLPHAPSEPEPEPAPAPAPASVPVSASASVPATTPAPNPVSAYVSPSTPSPAPAPSAGVEAGSGSEADGAQRLHVLPQKPEAPTPSPAAAPARTAEDSGAARGAKRERTVPVEREMNEAEAQWIGAFSNVARAPRWRRLKAEGGEDEEEKGSAMSSGDAAVPSSVLRLRAFSTPARRGAKRGGRMPRGRKAVGAVVRRRVGDSVIQGHVRGYNREAKLYVLEFENEREEAVPFRELKHIVLRDPRAHGDVARADDPESVEAALQAVVESGGASDAQNREWSWAAGESTPQSAAAAPPSPSDDDPCVGPRGLLAASPPSPAPAAAAATTAAASRDLGPVVQAQSEAAGWVGVAEEPESDATATPSTQASADRRAAVERIRWAMAYGLVEHSPTENAFWEEVVQLVPEFSSADEARACCQDDLARRGDS